MARNEEEIFEKEFKRELLSSNSIIVNKLDEVMKRLDSVSTQLTKLSEDINCLLTPTSNEAEYESIPEVGLEEKFGRRVM
jgi:hypothetical protein